MTLWQEIYSSFNPPASEASSEVANLTLKNQHTLIYGVKVFVCLSVCLSVCPSVTMCASSKNCEMGLFRPDLDSVL